MRDKEQHGLMAVSVIELSTRAPAVDADEWKLEEEMTLRVAEQLALETTK
jgi:hypothetical protein